MENREKIDTAISKEFRLMLMVIAENITEFHGSIPLEIKKAYKDYAVGGNIEDLEKVRHYLYDQTGLLELHIPLI